MIAPISIPLKLITAGTVCLLVLFPSLMGQWALNAAKHDNFEQALKRLRLASWLPGYPKMVKGIILLDAGRYREAQTFLKPLAFDSHGSPHLGSRELYLYAMTLSNSGDEEGAQWLLERAALVRLRPAVMNFPQGAVPIALAGCLLAQKKDAARAEQIIQQVLSDTSAKKQTANRAYRISLHAWALANCGRVEEAKTELANAFASMPMATRATVPLCNIPLATRGEASAS